MSNALVPIDFNQLPAAPVMDEETFNDVAKGADYLQRLQLVGKGKFIDKGKIKPGHYGVPLPGDEIIDLGNRVDILALAWRPKALDMSDSPIFTSYNSADPRFQEVKRLSDVKDSKCQYGISFLVLERTTLKFLELFLGTKSFRPEGKKIRPNIPVTQADIDAIAAAGKDITGMEPHGAIPMTLTSQYIEREFSWWVPVVLECSSPFTKFPSQEQYVKELMRFRAGETQADPTEGEAPKSGRKR